MALTSEQIEQIKRKMLEQIDKMPADKASALREQIIKATPEQIEEYLNPKSECLFCGIGQGKINTFKVYEDAGVVAFLDITPANVGHVIISPKEHYQFLFQLPDQLLWDVTKLIKMLTPLVVNSTNSQGVNLYVAQGHAAGQVMEHLSINLIPRFENDKVTFAWERNNADKKELEDMTNKLGSSLSKALSEEKEKIESALRKKMESQPKKSAEPEKLEKFPKRRL